MIRPRLSLCMIVRNEAEMLPGLLAGVHGLWDELVAVDTGSADATRLILQREGAIVLERPWKGDFAAARNESLDAAQGDWVLVLDADERVSPPLATEIRGAISDPRWGAASLLVRNRLPHGQVRGSRILRLFRRDPAVRFRHAIHEDASESVERCLARTGLGRADLLAPLEHLGYVRDHAAARGKKERDVRILRAVLEREPDDLYSWLKLMEQARFWDDRHLLSEASQAAAAAVERASAAGLSRLHFAGELLALAADGLHARPDAALAWLDRFAGRIPPSAHFHLRRAELRELLGDAAGARAELERCLALEGETGHVQLATVRPRLALARLALGEGDAAAALRHAGAALARAPRDPEGLLLAASIHRALGGPEALRRFADERRAVSGDVEEIDAALGEAALLAGDAATAVHSLARAAGDPPSGPHAVLLARARLAAGDVDGARALALELASGLPSAGLGLLLCDLAQGRDSALELDLDLAEAERSLRAWLGPVLAARPPAVLAGLRRNAGAASALFPWLAGAVG